MKLTTTSPHTAEFKNKWRYTSTPYVFVECTEATSHDLFLTDDFLETRFSVNLPSSTMFPKESFSFKVYEN